MKIRDNTVTNLTLDSVDLFSIAYGLRGVSAAMESLLDSGLPTDEAREEMARDLNFAACLLSQINQEILCLVADSDALEDAMSGAPGPDVVSLPRSLAATAIRLAAWTEYRSAGDNGELPQGVTVDDLRQLFRCLEQQDVLPSPTDSEEVRHAH